MSTDLPETDERRAIPESATHVRERFWSKVDVGGDDECWEWQRYTDDRGYGHFWYAGNVRMSHRISYRMEVESISEEQQINHKCGNPSCVNPDHLYAGTQRENWADAVEHGTRTRKLSHDDIREIRRRYQSEDVTQYELADEYGVHQHMISQVVRREVYDYVE